MFLDRVGLLMSCHSLDFLCHTMKLPPYKQSVLQDGKFGNVNHYPACFTQWVADNVDHNSSTLDGKGSFNGMGVIAVSTPTDE